MLASLAHLLAVPARALTRWSGLALFAAAVPLAAFAQAPSSNAGLAAIPALTARVTDVTHTLSPSETQALSTKLADWETKTGNQLAVLMVPTTQPEAIEAYSIRVAEAWKLGKKGVDNGALLLIAKDDRKMRIEVGYGLEGVLTDLTSRRIIAEDIAPQFREGKWAAGINAGVDRIISVVGSGAPLPATPEPARRTADGGGFDIGTLVLLVFIVVPLVGKAMRSIFGGVAGSTIGAGVIGVAAWFLLGSLIIAVIAAIVAFLVIVFGGVGNRFAGRGGGVAIPSGGWGGGGGGFSGGGGGFSGGGGSFGGGGASGSW